MAIRPRDLCSDCSHSAPLGTLPGLYTCKALSSPVALLPSHCLFYSGPRRPVDVVIITAVQAERDAVIMELHPDGPDAWTPMPTLSNGIWQTCVYRSSKDEKVSVRLVLIKTRLTGPCAAANTTALSIQLFRPSHVVMLGITAGRKNKTSIGDIVVPLELWDYGSGKWEEVAGELRFKPRGERQSIDEHIRQCCDSLAMKTTSLRQIRDDWLVRHPDRPAFATPNVHFTPMVSGAAVVNAESIWQRVLDQNDKVLAIDMEAYSVAYATRCAAIPHYHPNCFIAKSVCDFGVDKEKDAQPYAAYTSVRFFKLYLDEFILGVESQRNPMRQNVLPME